MKRFIMSVIGAILFVAFMLLIAIKTDKLLHPIKVVQEPIYYWDSLQEYSGKLVDSIINMIGEPSESGYALVTGEGSLGPQSMLYDYLSSPKDSIYFKELLWKQDNYNFYIWFQKKDSIWISVRGIKYDPNLVQF